MRQRKSSPEEVYSRAHFPDKPNVKTLEFVQKNKAHREAAGLRLQERGDAYGSLFSKLFPKDKGNVALMKILSEQAIKLDILLNELVMRGKAANIEEAFDLLQKDNHGVLNPSSNERISKEESVRGEVLKVAYAIQNRKWEKASTLLKKIEGRKDTDQDTIKVFHEELGPIIRESLSGIFDKKDSKGIEDFKNAVFYLFNIAGLKNISLGDLPRRVSKSQDLLKSIQGDYLFAIEHPDYFGGVRTGWRNFGVDTKAIERSPTIIAAAQKYLLAQFGRREYAILYKSVKEKYLTYGVLTKEEIEQQRLTEIAPRAKKYLLNQLGEGRYPSLYRSLRDAFVSYGVLTAQEAESINKSPEVQKYLRKGI